MSSGERLRNRLILAALGAALGLCLVVYPQILASGVARMGVQPLALGLLVLGVLGTLLTRGFGRRALGAATLAVPTLLALAAATGKPIFLQLVPAAVYGVAAGVLTASLGAPMSLMERAVRTMIPAAPDFIADYCRGLTRFWAWFFAVTAGIIAGLALAGLERWWQAFTSWGVFSAMLAAFVIEFAFRKTRFRYYYVGGPIDRIWSRFFPAEKTPLGRKSLEYIRIRREQIQREHEAEMERRDAQEGPDSPSL